MFTPRAVKPEYCPVRGIFVCTCGCGVKFTAQRASAIYCEKCRRIKSSLQTRCIQAQNKGQELRSCACGEHFPVTRCVTGRKRLCPLCVKANLVACNRVNVRAQYHKNPRKNYQISQQWKTNHPDRVKVYITEGNHSLAGTKRSIRAELRKQTNSSVVDESLVEALAAIRLVNRAIRHSTKEQQYGNKTTYVV